VETARQYARSLDLDKELEALLADDIRVISKDDFEENPRPAKRSRNMENTEAAVLKTTRSPASKEKSHKTPATLPAKEKKEKNSIGSLELGKRHQRSLDSKTSLSSPVLIKHNTPRTPLVHPSEGIFEATYSDIQVYEFIINDVAIMRRKRDSWVNGTQILKAAGLNKLKRTKILEKQVHHGDHEKVQGGYGRYQGTWIPLERARILAHDFGVADALAPILDLP
jgi:hypothetical protein